MYRYAQYKEHPFPEAVAVQAGYESRYGASEVARNANNLFGIKARKNRRVVIFQKPISYNKRRE